MNTTFKTLALTALMAAVGTTYAHAGDYTAPAPADPGFAGDQNLLSNPGFIGENCSLGWEATPPGLDHIICNTAGESIWLNDDNIGDDPSVSQEISGLKLGEKYIFEMNWRGGKTAATFAGNGPKPIAGVTIGDTRKVFNSEADYSTWKDDSVEFIATTTSMTVKIFGEADNLDGDVEVNWAGVFADKVKNIPARSKMSTAANGGTIGTGVETDYLIINDDQIKIAKTTPELESAVLTVSKLDNGTVAFQVSDKWLTVSAETAKGLGLNHYLTTGSDINARAVFNVRPAPMPICSGSTRPQGEFCTLPDELFMSYESSSHPGMYLRHYSQRVGLATVNKAPNNIEKGDVTWKLEPVN